MVILQISPATIKDIDTIIGLSCQLSINGNILHDATVDKNFPNKHPEFFRDCRTNNDCLYIVAMIWSNFFAMKLEKGQQNQGSGICVKYKRH